MDPLSFRKSINDRMVRKVLLHIANTGRSLPAEVVKKDKTGTILTLKFDTDGTFTIPNIDVPANMSDWHRHPVQKGDKGVVRSSNTIVSNQDGLGPDSASPFTQPGNMSSLVFHFIGNSKFTQMDDPDAHLLHGKTGTINRDTNKKSRSIIHPDKGSLIQTGGDGNDSYKHEVGATSAGTHSTTTESHTTTAPKGHNVSHDQSVGGNHSIAKDGSVGGNHTVAKNSSTGGNHSVGGLLSAAQASFGSIAGGGGGGGFSFGAEGNATVSTITTTRVYTVAQLLALVGPFQQGMRTWVTDYKPTTSGSNYLDWLKKVVSAFGGGTLFAPVFTDGTQWLIG